MVNKKITSFIVLGVAVFYYIIDLIIGKFVFSLLVFENKGFSINFIGIPLLIFTSLLVGFFIEIIFYQGKTKKRKW